MSTSWQRRERTAAKTLRTTRTHRARYQSAPDMPAVALPDGTMVQPEVKHRKSLPKLLTDALAQARRYSPSAEPLAIVSERGGPQLAVMELLTFARLVGLALDLPKRPRRRRRAPVQTEMFAGGEP